MEDAAVPLRYKDRHQHFVLESLSSALLITLYVMVNDFLHAYLEKTPLSTCCKYSVIFVSMFLCALCTIYILFIMFGYRSDWGGFRHEEKKRTNE